jgi:hypothetical protein
MKNQRLCALPLILMMLAITVPVFDVSAVLPPWLGYVKPAYPDYAPSGMPDFDQKQDAWGPPHSGLFTWCGPVSVADSLWWLDSEYESVVFANPVPPPTISDHFPLVQNYTAAWDDHNSTNVIPLVTTLAFLMDTDGMRTGDGHTGTRLQDLINGTKYYLARQGASQYFEVHNTTFPSFTWVSNEILNCQDVELFLEFYRLVGSSWVPFTGDPNLEYENGHFVACAGVNTSNLQNGGQQVLISDPYQDAYLAGKSPGRSPAGAGDHNDAGYVSQDAYNMTVRIYSPPMTVPPPPGYPNTVYVLDGYLQTMGWGDDCYTFVKAAVATSPVPQWPGYTKPAYPDYSPSGMPDFDENQNQFTTKPGQFTWCAPVAVANSLWWLDSEYESLMFANPVAPPTKSDHFNLVNSSQPNQWDDHDPNNVASLVRDLAILMDTDNLTSKDGHMGTRFTDVQSGIQQYLKRQGVDSLFEVHNSSFPTFAWIDKETQVCQDVEIFLEFWEWNPLIMSWTTPSKFTEPQLLYGHCVTCAGSNSTTSQLLISDPYQDQYEAGNVPGRSLIPHLYPHNTAVHNDAQYVSQDAYSVSLVDFTKPPFNGVAPPGYGTDASQLDSYLQLTAPGYPPTYYAFIIGAVATSTTGVHDIAVTNVTSYKTIIDRGYLNNITVTTNNLGNYTETFNTTVYANQTIIATSMNTTLAVADSTTMMFTWNTTGFAYGNYTIWAYAGPVPGQTSTDNNCTDGLVLVTIPGDVDGNFKVDMTDVMLILSAFGSKTGQPRYIANSDIDGSLQIDMTDVMICFANFGQHYP